MLYHVQIVCVGQENDEKYSIAFGVPILDEDEVEHLLILEVERKKDILSHLIIFCGNELIYHIVYVELIILLENIKVAFTLLVF